ncbi:hypothetical protein TcYC6_0080860 [Trypanosoma cruzi]|nr:hypothetical protein TcYC6_0080860 [Trypanosoma cruzi]
MPHILLGGRVPFSGATLKGKQSSALCLTLWASLEAVGETYIAECRGKCQGMRNTWSVKPAFAKDPRSHAWVEGVPSNALVAEWQEALHYLNSQATSLAALRLLRARSSLLRHCGSNPSSGEVPCVTRTGL